jgi:hypothetical protein
MRDMLYQVSLHGWKKTDLKNIVHRVLGFIQKNRFISKVFRLVAFGCLFIISLMKDFQVLIVVGHIHVIKR